VVVEMRTYKTAPARRSEFLELFRAKSVPAHRAIGTTIAGRIRRLPRAKGEAAARAVR
jgi:hypothetical protein